MSPDEIVAHAYLDLMDLITDLQFPGKLKKRLTEQQAGNRLAKYIQQLDINIPKARAQNGVMVATYFGPGTSGPKDLEFAKELLEAAKRKEPIVNSYFVNVKDFFGTLGKLKKCRQQYRLSLRQFGAAQLCNITPHEATRITSAIRTIYDYFYQKSGNAGKKILKEALRGLDSKVRLFVGEEWNESADYEALNGPIYDENDEAWGILLRSNYLQTKGNFQTIGGIRFSVPTNFAPILQNELFEVAWRRTFGHVIGCAKFQALSAMLSEVLDQIDTYSQDEFLARYDRYLIAYKAKTEDGDIPLHLLKRDVMKAAVQNGTMPTQQAATSRSHKRSNRILSSEREVDKFFDLLDAMIQVASGGKITSNDQLDSLLPAGVTDWGWVELKQSVYPVSSLPPIRVAGAKTCRMSVKNNELYLLVEGVTNYTNHAVNGECIVVVNFAGNPNPKKKKVRFTNGHAGEPIAFPKKTPGDVERVGVSLPPKLVAGAS